MLMKILVYICLLASACIRAVNSASVNTAFSSEEVIKLNKLQQLTSDRAKKNFMKTDGYLIRWLRAKNLDVDASLAGIKQALAWRAENNIDNILNERVIEEHIRSPYYRIDGVDKERRPVLIFEMANVDIRKYAVSGQSKLFLRSWFQLMERVEDSAFKNVNTNSTSGLAASQQATAVYDFTGYNLRQHGCLQCFPIYGSFIAIFEGHYPSVFASASFINTPRIFVPLLEFLKPLMSTNTRKTLKVYGPDKKMWQPKLLEIIDANQLPVKFGGNKMI